MGRGFQGCYDLRHDRLLLLDRNSTDTPTEGEACNGLDDPQLEERLRDDAVDILREEVGMAREGYAPTSIWKPTTKAT